MARPTSKSSIQLSNNDACTQVLLYVFGHLKQIGLRLNMYNIVWDSYHKPYRPRTNWVTTIIPTSVDHWSMIKNLGLKQQNMSFFSLMLSILVICIAVKVCYREGNLQVGDNDVGCQHKSTIGRDYRGTANTTRTGIPCQNWSDTQPHNHQFTTVGEHNFCRNPENSGVNKLWCRGERIIRYSNSIRIVFE